MTLNTQIERAISAFAIVGTLAFGAWAGSAIGHASPSADRYDSPSVTMTVDGVDYPVCAEEDCSDQVGQVGLWYSRSMGAWLLELGESCTGSIPAECHAVTYIVTP